MSLALITHNILLHIPRKTAGLQADMALTLLPHDTCGPRTRRAETRAAGPRFAPGWQRPTWTCVLAPTELCRGLPAFLYLH